MGDIDTGHIGFTLDRNGLCNHKLKCCPDNAHFHICIDNYISTLSKKKKKKKAYFTFNNSVTQVSTL